MTTLEQINVDNLVEMLDLVQSSSACHVKYAALLKKTIKTAEDRILKKLCSGMMVAFFTSYKEKNPYVDRIVNFMAVFATSYNSPNNSEEDVQLHPILHKILKFILQLSKSANDSHRYWSCVLFNKIFRNLGELQEEMCEEVQESMLARLNDPKAVIRCQAILALHCLQDPTNDQDVIISEMCAILNSDYSAKVRQLGVEKIALNKRALPVILDRIRDVDLNVRLSAFRKVQRVAKYLKVAQRRLVLECGFSDSFEKIRLFTTTELLHTWLETYNNDYLKLMKSIRLDACEEDIKLTVHLAELLLQALFKGTPIDDIIQYLNVDENKLIKHEDLNWESVLYYRICVQFLRQSDAYEENLDTVLPELVHFCEYIKKYCRFMKDSNCDPLQYQFILQQLFLITKGYDVGDPASRQCLTSLVYYMLTSENLSTDTAETVISNLERTISSANNRAVFIYETISNVMCGDENIDYEQMKEKELERSHSISQLQSDVSSLRDQENHFAFVERDLKEAARIQQEILEKKALLAELRSVREKSEQNEKKTDVMTMSKVLNIATGLLLSPTITKFCPAIATLHSKIITPVMLHDDPRIAASAVRCYGLCCVIDETTARYGIHIFSGILFSDDAEIDLILISLKVVVDLIIIYGLNLIHKRDQVGDETPESQREEGKKVFVGGTSLSDLIPALVVHLEHEEPEVQYVATKGVCMLLMAKRITSPSLLSRLIIKWANPATEDTLKQFIGQTLNKLVALDNCHTYFGEAVINTIETLAYAPRNSPLADIDVDNIIKFMVTLCEIPSQAASIQTNLASKICDLMLENPIRKIIFLLSKALLLLSVPEGDSRDELLVKCDDLKEVIRDGPTLKNVNKWSANLTKNGGKKLVAIEEGQDSDES